MEIVRCVRCVWMETFLDLFCAVVTISVGVDELHVILTV